MTVLAVGAAAGGAYFLLRTQGSPAETAQRFTAAWQAGDLARMTAELAAPVSLAAYDQQRKGLAVEALTVKLANPAQSEGRATAAFTVALKLKNAGQWSYPGKLDLKVVDRQWKVDWTPAALHPQLTDGAEWKLRARWPDRAAITDSTGERIDTGSVGGSVQQLVGFLDKATKKDVARLGPSYKVGDAIGRGGLQETFQKRLAGTPATEIMLGGKTLAKIEGSEGKALETTLDPRVQAAAVGAVRDLDKPTSLVAIKRSTGEIAAVVNNQGGFNRALDGNYPPGSTFKAVTALGLLAAGTGTGDEVTCPKYATVGGLKVRNSEHAAYGSLSFSDAFAYSCNTTFAPMTQEKLSADQLVDAAELVGFNQALTIGVPAAKPSFPKAQSDAELAAESFGQAKITASPLAMAAATAAIAEGTWRPPTLVPELKQKAKERELPGEAVEQLHQMMAAVVTKGTAKAAGLPPGTRGKTGTAEYGTGDPLPSHAWFIGFDDDLAFAVVVEGGGGGKVAAPVGAAFLRGL